jgi:CRISPR system Cascade subunit CasE
MFMEATMYLSKILVSGPACHNPYEIHRSLWKLFPKDGDARRDFLFHVVRSDQTRAEILMQSGKEPEKSSAMTQVLASKQYRPAFAAGYRLRFLLHANPIKMINDEGGRKNARGETKKCRVPLIREDDQRSWIARKLRDAASLEILVIDPASPLRFRKAKENRAGKIQPVIFQGILTVENAEAITEMIKNGVGPAKAFGCGLMLVRRV